MTPIGIDLGTTNSLIAVWDENNTQGTANARLISNTSGSYLTPSAVSILDNGNVIVGHAAYERRLSHPDLTATEFKRDMGSTREYKLGSHTFSPEQLSALVLSSLKSDAEAELGKPVRFVVITVPAYFNDIQRKATVVAANLANLEVTRLINEPTAAALSYGIARQDAESNNTLVFDLGGGTFDVSLVDFFEGIVEIRASTGDNYLGGEDFTSVIATLLADKLAITNERLKSNEMTARLRSSAERLKRELTKQPIATVVFKLDDQDISVSITEDELETACEHLLEKIRTPVNRAIRDARLDIESLDYVVLVGGATRMPIVRKLVSRVLGRFPDVSIHPDEAIALGAASQAAMVAKHKALDEVLLTDVCPYSLGIAVAGVTANLDDPRFNPLIERNTIIPASRLQHCVNVVDNQRKVLIEIYQGEHRFAKDNIKIGSTLIKIPKGPAGTVVFSVRFSYDTSGILDVDIHVDSSDKKYSLTILGNAASLDDKEISKRRQQLEKLKLHPRDDTANRAVIERAERLYREFSGKNRLLLGDALDKFMLSFETQDPTLIKEKRIEFSKWLDEAEDFLLI